MMERVASIARNVGLNELERLIKSIRCNGNMRMLMRGPRWISQHS